MDFKPLQSVGSRILLGKLFSIASVILFSSIIVAPSIRIFVVFFLLLVIFWFWSNYRESIAFAISLFIFLFTIIWESHPVVIHQYQALSEWKSTSSFPTRQGTISTNQEEIPFIFGMKIEEFNSTQFVDELSADLKVPAIAFRVRIAEVETEDKFDAFLQIYDTISPPIFEKTAKEIAQKLRNEISNNHPLLMRYHAKMVEQIPRIIEEAEDFLGGAATVDVYRTSKMTISGGGDICEGQASSLMFTMTGAGPWNITFHEIDGFETYTIGQTLENPLKIPWKIPGTYKLGNAPTHSPYTTVFEREQVKGPTDSHCAISDLAGSATVRVHTLPTGRIVEGGTLYEGEKSFLTFELIGTPPFDIAYTDGDRIYYEKAIPSSPHLVEASKPGIYRLLNISDAICTNSNPSAEVSLKIAQRPCSGHSVLTERCGKVQTGYASNLECSWQLTPADGPFEYIEFNIPQCHLSKEDQICIYRGVRPNGEVVGCWSGDAAAKIKTPKITDEQLYIEFTSGSTHKNLDYGCTIDYCGIPLEQSCTEQPDAVVSGGRCVGDDIAVTFLAGTPPFTLTFFENNQEVIERNIDQSVYLIKAERKLYRFEKLADQVCRKKAKTLSAVVDPIPAPGGFLEGGGFILEGESANISVFLSGIPPWNVSIASEVSQYSAENITISPYVFLAKEPGLYRITSLQDASGCRAEISGFAEVDFYALPSISVREAFPICAGIGSELDVKLTGVSPWSLEYSFTDLQSLESRYFNISNIRKSPYKIQVSKPGTYNFLTVTDAKANSVTLSAVRTTVDELPLPTAAFVTCNEVINACPGQYVDIKVKVSGAPAFLTYSDGINFLHASIYEADLSSDKIFPLEISTVGTYHLESIASEFCPNYELDSSCTVTVAPKPAPQVSLSGGQCLGEDIRISLTGTPPWVLSYRIRANQDVVSVKLQSDQNLPAQGVRVEDSDWFTKTIWDAESVIAADRSGIWEFISLEDGMSCQGTIAGSPIFVAEPPTATLIGEKTMCKDESAELRVELTGTLPWNLTLTDGTETFEVKNVVSSPFRFPADKVGTYKVLEISDRNCFGKTRGEAVVANYPSPSVRFDRSYACFGDEIRINFEGTAPWNFAYEISSSTGELKDSRPNVHTQNSEFVIKTQPISARKGSISQLKISSISDQNCASANVAELPLFPIPTAVLSGGGIVCPDDEFPTLNVELMGIPPWEVHYTDGHQVFVEKVGYNQDTGIVQTTHSIRVLKTGNYYLTAISDAHCKFEKKKS